MADAENRDGVAVLVDLLSTAPKAIRVNITILEDVLTEMDRYAEAHGYTRSGFIVQAAKKAMEDA